MDGAMNRQTNMQLENEYATCAETLEESREKYRNGEYEKQLEVGLQFQDVATTALYQRGIVVVGYASRRFQNEKGENMLGAEIKRDGNFRETGNLYIELAEKSHPDNDEYIPSGIMRDDNSWLFVIGDERTLYIFATEYLKKLYDKRGWRKVQKPTSRGCLMPLIDADNYCIRKIELDEP
jgi:hypothetical protein